MKKYIAAGILAIAAVFYLAAYQSSEQPNLGGITRTVSYSTSSVQTFGNGTQVLSINTRAKYRRVQQDTNATVYCFAASTSSVTSPGGIRLTQGQSYEWSADRNNLWPGAISCIASGTTSTLLTEEHYE